MLAGLLLCLLTGSAPPAPALGDTVKLQLPVPEGWRAQPLQSDSTFALLWQRGDSAAVVPLVLDTLRMPPLVLVREDDTTAAQMPAIPVRSTMADTSYRVSFPSRVDPRIPPGLPGDYTDRHRFWDSMGAPSSQWLSYALAAAALAAAAGGWLLLRRRRRRPGPAAEARPKSPAERAEALLETPAFASGDWEELYSRYDGVLREVIGAAAGLDCRPLTYTQIAAALSARPDGRELWSEAEPLAREVVLQLYAGWGSSRERAASHVRRLASLAERWCGR
ncbi:MAG: hypothetical protein R6U36_04655 [Candidatus Fermentibacteraceae bacterium]